jgi:hypothetical protein
LGNHVVGGNGYRDVFVAYFYFVLFERDGLALLIATGIDLDD